MQTPAPGATIPRKHIVWGAYAGNVSGITQFETLAEKPVEIAATFVSFEEPFPLHLTASIGEKDKTLLVFWEPTSGFDAIIGGRFDKHLAQFASSSRAYGHPVILIPFNEPNLNEEVWGYGQGGNTSQTFTRAWRHVHEFFRDVPNVAFGIAYTNVSIPDVEGNSITALYPGDEYVDYVGVDGFNGYDGWQTPEEVFGASVAELKTLSKPIYIFSVASKEDPRKAQWITDFFSWMKSTPEIKGFLWFNENKEFDWRVNSDPASLSAFRKGLN